MKKQQKHSPDIEKWLKLIRAKNVGATTFARLLDYFGSVDKALGASVSELTHVEGIGNKTAEQIAATRDSFDTKAELKLADKLDVWMINFNDPRYPLTLKRIYDPPPVLYVKGTLEKADNLCVAIVGSRRCSLYGSEQASRFAHLLSSAGVTICSGMARGIDTAAHIGALKAKGRTIAVQGCGLANIFPPENKKLFKQIPKSGACVSELPLSYEPISENFPPRNRIIAGLSLATLVIEAASRSGALITADMAMENGREVMAVPGKIDSPLSRGTNRLLKQGAKLVENIDDVMEALNDIGHQIKNHVTTAASQAAEVINAPLFDVSMLNLSDAEREIYDCLNSEPVHLEQLIAEADLAPGSVNAALISLRLKGLIKQLPGNLFLRK
ncbi:DNA-processing protein DprA [Planctomycetota bacterium]